MIFPAKFVAIAAALTAAVIAGALALGTLEWLSWRFARRLGGSLPGAGSWSDWLGGVAGLLHPDAERLEAPGAALGFAAIVFGAFLPTALLLWEASRIAPAASPSVRFGLAALSPLLVALGYAIAAERATTPSSARQRLATAGRIAFSLPGWLVAAALAASAFGTTAFPLVARAGLALALVGTGLFVLPGAAAEQELTSRTWGGDPRESSAAVRFLTGVAQYAALTGVCWIAASALEGRPPRAASLLGAVAIALVLRAIAALPGWGSWVRRVSLWIVPVLLLAYAFAGARLPAVPRVAGMFP